MNSYLAIPIAIGFSVVIQGFLNRQIGLNWGLSAAVLLNAVVFFLPCLALYLWTRWTSQPLPPFLQFPAEITSSISWWYLIPGLCGFFIVVGIPISLFQVGPSKTFIILIVSQIVFSLALEKLISGHTPGFLKIAGALIAVLGAALVALS